MHERLRQIAKLAAEEKYGWENVVDQYEQLFREMVGEPRAQAAIASVLEQSRPGIRILVSDNSTIREERQKLAAYCEARAEEALIYVRPPEPKPMAEHWRHHALDIVGQDERAALDRGDSLSGAKERDRGARATPERHILVPASGVHQLTHVNDELVSRLALNGAEDFWYTAADGAKVRGERTVEGYEQ